MRILPACILVLAMAGCGQSNLPANATTAAPSAVTEAVSPPPWAICDGIDSRSVVILQGAPQTGRSHLLRIDKSTRLRTFDEEIIYGVTEGAAGSIFTALMLNGAEAGNVRQINPDMLEAPGSAYTLPITEIRFQDTQLRCRWLPRTRLMGISDERSVVVHEDADGDLIYTTFDFNDASGVAPIELSENGHSTPFSVEVRGGTENITPAGARFQFEAGHDYSYRVIVEAGQGKIEVWRAGAMVLDEPLSTFQLGDAAN